MRHVGVHGEDREHDRDIVDDGGEEAYGDVGVCCAPVTVEDVGGDFEVADIAEAADAEDDAEEEEERVPFCGGDVIEDVEVPVAVLDVLDDP